LDAAGQPGNQRKIPFPQRSFLPVSAQVAVLALELHKVSHLKLPNRRFPVNSLRPSASG
jgi:hypothetical protein